MDEYEYVGETSKTGARRRWARPSERRNFKSTDIRPSRPLRRYEEYAASQPKRQNTYYKTSVEAANRQSRRRPGETRTYDEQYTVREDYDNLEADYKEADIDFSDFRMRDSNPPGGNAQDSQTSTSGDASTDLDADEKTASTERSYRIISRAFYPGKPMNTAELTAELIQLEKWHKGVHFLYKWMHMTNEYASFDYFRSCVYNSALLDQYERQDAQSFLQMIAGLREADVSLLPQSGSGSLVQRRQMESSFYNVSAVPESKDRGKSSLTWLCFPYFVFKQYSDPSKAGTPVDHPILTLLQTRYGPTTAQRDLRQAATILKPGSNSCFHVAKLWCLIASEKLIYTSVPFADFDRLRISGLHLKDPIPAPSSVEDSKFFRVTDGGRRQWQIPASECKSWPAFILHFADLPHFDPLRMRVSSKGIPLRPVDWDSTTGKSEHGPLQLELGPEINETNESVALQRADDLQQAEHGFTQEMATRLGLVPLNQIPNPGFRQIFVAAPEGGVSAGNKPNEEAALQPAIVSQVLASIDWYFAENCRNPKTKRQYFTCPESTYSDIFDSVTQKRRQLVSVLDEIALFGTRSESEKQQQYQTLLDSVSRATAGLTEQYGEEGDEAGITVYQEVRITDRSAPATFDTKTERSSLTRLRQQVGKASQKLYRAARFIVNARVICELFLPSGTDHKTVRKYWGAVHRLFRNADSSEFNISDIGSARILEDRLARLAAQANEMKQLLAATPGCVTTKIIPPEDLVREWLSILALIIQFGEDVGSRFLDRTESMCTSILIKGLTEMLKSAFGYQPLDKYETVLPFGVLTLIIRALAEDITFGVPSIIETYDKYYRHLEYHVDENPTDRTHQQVIRALRQEIGVVTATLTEQRSVLESFNEVADVESPWPNMPEQKEITLLQQVISTIDARIRQIEIISDNAAQLAEQNLQSIDTSKDRQETAILIFTVFSVLFLPSSFIAQFLSILPLSFQDIGSMQWLFWAISIPFTIILIIIVLSWAGELGNVVGSLKNFVLKGQGLAQDNSLGVTGSSDRAPTVSGRANGPAADSSRMRRRRRLAPIDYGRRSSESTRSETARYYV